MSVSDHFTAPRMQGLAGTESAKLFCSRILIFSLLIIHFLLGIWPHRAVHFMSVYINTYNLHAFLITGMIKITY